MKRFDYSFLEKGMIPASLVNVVSAIAELRVRVNRLKENYPDVFIRLKSIAKVQSIKGLNAIERIVTSEQRFNEIVNQNSAPKNRNEAEIAGYRDALNLVHENHASLDIREQDILRLHEIILSYTPVRGGAYKQSDSVVIKMGSASQQRVLFAPTPANETAAAMEQLVLAFMEARSNYEVNRLLLIPCFILDFLCIHPFTDGNGRVSRLLSLLMFYKNDFDAAKYISFDEQINKSKWDYYEAMRLSSEGWHENTNSYFPFVEIFVANLLYCYKELDKRFAEFHAKKVNKREQIEATVLNSLLPISKLEICYVLPDVSPTTVEATLAAMVRNRTVDKVGSGKNTKYIKRV